MRHLSHCIHGQEAEMNAELSALVRGPLFLWSGTPGLADGVGYLQGALPAQSSLVRNTVKDVPRSVSPMILNPTRRNEEHQQDCCLMV